MIVLKIEELSGDSLREAERAVILRALRDSGGHAETAAYVLEMGVSTMYRKIVEHEITDDERDS